MKRALVIAAATLALIFTTSAPAFADVNDFEFESFDGRYSLSADDNGRSMLTTVETLTAVFPATDQNQGIQRRLPTRFDGHPVDIEVVSVTDQNDRPRAFELEEDDDMLIVTIKDDGVYVHGTQVYVITYTQRNVTRDFEAEGVQELYWDTNGLDWQQPFGRVTASVTVEGDAASAVVGARAYYGPDGATTPATVQELGDGEFRFGADNLGPGENLTFAIGFEPGTFEKRDASFWASPAPLISLIGALVALIAAVVAVSLRRRSLADAPGRPTIIAEYLPPKGESIHLAALISSTVGRSTAAAIVGLAVSGKLRIHEIAGKKASFELEFVTAEGAHPDDVQFLHALFGSSLTPGENRSLTKVDAAAAKKIVKLHSAVARAATSAGYRRPINSGLISGVVVATAIPAAVGLIFAVVALEDAVGGAWPIVTLVLSIVALVASVVAVAKHPLDARGAELRDYLRGLKLYISLAERDRLAFLQSPQGAQRIPVATNDKASLVHLNERLLPFAILFGQEKEWSREIGKYYEDLGEQPSWYSGNSAFSGAVFASGLSSLSTSAATAYTSSSSTGGSGGGGSSGGGGGGGGGGGV